LGAGIVVSLALVVSATGILYLLHGLALPGPVVRDALPLDELPKHDAVPLLLFAGVWAAVGLLLGGIARALRAERLTAAFLLGLGVWSWTYVSVGVSLLVVRQIPANDAFEAAAHLRAAYVPAALAALGGAVCGRTPVAARSRSPLLVAWLVGVTGAVSALDGILPASPPPLLAELSLTRVSPVASALVAPLGLALVIAARGARTTWHWAWSSRSRSCTSCTASTSAPSPPRSSPSCSSRAARTSTRPATRRRDPVSCSAPVSSSSASTCTARSSCGRTGSRPTSRSRFASRCARRAAPSPVSRSAARRTSRTGSAPGSRSPSSSPGCSRRAGCSSPGSPPGAT